MNTKYLWNANFPLTFYSNINDVLMFIKNNKLNQKEIFVADSYNHDDEKLTNSYFLSVLEDQSNEESFDIIYTDDYHPAFSYNCENDAIYLNTNIYNKYKSEIIKVIKNNYLTKDNLLNIYINLDLYDEEFIKNILKVHKRCIVSFEEDVVVSKEMLNYLRENYIVSYHGNKMISKDTIFGYTPESLFNAKSISIKANEPDYEDLKLISNNTDLKILANNSRNPIHNYYHKINNIISYMRDNGKNNKVTFAIHDRQKFEKSELFSKNYDNVIIDNEMQLYTFEEFKKETKLLNLMVKDINEKDFTEFEKYLAIYNIVKKFKAYQKTDGDLSEQSVLRLILNNEYIVCSGFRELLIDLLSRVGIKAISYSVFTDTSYDDGYTLEEKPITFSNHARVIVKINDNKYNVQGFYIADPTWDNDLEKDYYNHALMTFDKTADEHRFFKLSNQDLFMNIKDMEEFTQKINFLLDKKIRNECFKGSEHNAYLEEVTRVNLIMMFYIVIEAFDKEYYLHLLEKYNNENFTILNNRDFNNYLTEIGNYFIRDLGKEVPLSNILTAATNINKQFITMSKQDFDVYSLNLFKENYYRELECFPYNDVSKKVI